MSAWYNENDPYAAQWLRNLIAAGHLPAGEVDDRSIVDVRAADLAGFDLRLGEECACAEKPSRVGMLRGAGNAISPPVAAAFVAAFLETRWR